MAAVSMALALIGGVIGAGFASGREILRFFAIHGRAAPAAIACACALMMALICRLPALMEKSSVRSLTALCQTRLGRRFGLACSTLFMLLFAVTGGAMLAACAELGALMLPFRHAYGHSMACSLLLAALLALHGLIGLTLPGALLFLLLPALLFLLLRLPAGEACFFPAQSADLPIRALLSGAAYAALSIAQLCGLLPLMVYQDSRTRFRSAAWFTLLFGSLLSLGTAVCQRHLPAIHHQALPFVFISRALGAGGYTLVALCLYASALSTLCAMLRALMQDAPSPANALIASITCLILASQGFDSLIANGYPMLGALCAGLLLALCMPVFPKTSQNESMSVR